jgi:hypothetical protein
MLFLALRCRKEEGGPSIFILVNTLLIKPQKIIIFLEIVGLLCSHLDLKLKKKEIPSIFRIVLANLLIKANYFYK